VNKQLSDKERVAAALENEKLLEVVNKCIANTDPQDQDEDIMQILAARKSQLQAAAAASASGSQQLSSSVEDLLVMGVAGSSGSSSSNNKSLGAAAGALGATSMTTDDDGMSQLFNCDSGLFPHLSAPGSFSHAAVVPGPRQHDNQQHSTASSAARPLQANIAGTRSNPTFG
jgi:hypothetical protein